MQPEELKQNVTVYGPLFPEPVQIILAVPMGTSVKLIGKGALSRAIYEPILSADQLKQLRASSVDDAKALITRSWHLRPLAAILN